MPVRTVTDKKTNDNRHWSECKAETSGQFVEM